MVLDWNRLEEWLRQVEALGPVLQQGHKSLVSGPGEGRTESPTGD